MGVWPAQAPGPSRSSVLNQVKLIGGTYDGKVVDINVNYPVVYLPVQTLPSLNDAALAPMIKYEEYERSIMEMKTDTVWTSWIVYEFTGKVRAFNHSHEK